VALATDVLILAESRLQDRLQKGVQKIRPSRWSALLEKRPSLIDAASPPVCTNILSAAALSLAKAQCCEVLAHSVSNTDKVRQHFAHCVSITDKVHQYFAARTLGCYAKRSGVDGAITAALLWRLREGR
jgi:hypothetical protein